MSTKKLGEVYQEPQMSVVAVDLEQLIASSAIGHSNEGFIYEGGDPQDWDD